MNGIMSDISEAFCALRRAFYKVLPKMMAEKEPGVRVVILFDDHDDALKFECELLSSPLTLQLNWLCDNRPAIIGIPIEIGIVAPPLQASSYVKVMS